MILETVNTQKIGRFDIYQKYKQFLETWCLKNKKNIIIIMTQLCDMSHHLYAFKVNYRPCDGRSNSDWLETKLLWHVPLRLAHIVMQIKLQCIFQLSWNLMRQLLLTLKYSPGYILLLLAVDHILKIQN